MSLNSDDDLYVTGANEWNKLHNPTSTGDCLTHSQRSDCSTNGYHSDIPSNLRARAEKTEEDAILQAVVFLEDAVNYRSIHHKVDGTSLRLYRFYHSTPVRWGMYLVIAILLLLAFIEHPSSLTKTSDIRRKVELPAVECGVVESVECLCLAAFIIDLFMKSYLIGKQQFCKTNWLIAYTVVMFLYVVDWTVSVSMLCSEERRLRRLLRPFFLLQNSSLMKKTVNCLRRALPEVFSLLLLLFLHIYIFALFGMLLFPSVTQRNMNNSTDAGMQSSDSYTEEGNLYFHSLPKAFMSLLILLTTANNPDVSLPAYTEHRLYALFFIAFLVIGFFCLMNMLLAVIYNQFRGYFQSSMQASLLRRRLGVRAAFEVLRRFDISYDSFQNPDNATQIPAALIRQVINRIHIQQCFKQPLLQSVTGDSPCDLIQFKEIFKILDVPLKKSRRPEIVFVRRPILMKIQKICTHRYFGWFSSILAIIHIIIMSIMLITQYDSVMQSPRSYLTLVNCIFALYYMVEQLVKIWAHGFRRYISFKGYIFEFVLTLCLECVIIWHMVEYGPPISSKYDTTGQRGALTVFELIRISNMLVLLRLIPVITDTKILYMIVSTMIDLLHNLRALTGIILVIYYDFAIVGMYLFHGVILKPPNNSTDTPSQIPPCGSYEQLEYWPNNFDDFAASLVVLWDVMVVNNWMVFLDVYSRYTSNWSQIFFIVWWLVSVVICANLFIALIIENFISKWDTRAQQIRRERRATETELTNMSVHQMFNDQLQEPNEAQIQTELSKHSYLQFEYMRSGLI